MRSHHYAFDAKWIAQLLGILLLCLVAGAITLRLTTPILPPPRNAWDMDRTIMAHQVDAATKVKDADILLIGDSSCLMNIDASIVSKQLGLSVVNLGTLSFLNTEMFKTLLSRYFETANKAPSSVILVTHPDFLRRSSASKSHVTWMNQYLAGEDDRSSKASWKSIHQWLGAHIIQGRLLTFLPRPLSVEFGRQFGFTKDLERYMDLHGGSALDPRTLDASKLKGSREYRISSANKQAAETFRDILPENTRLYVSLSPLPEGFMQAQLTEDLNALRTEWAVLLHADKALSSLPLALPNDQFASKTHLHPSAVDSYSKAFAEALR